MTDYVYDIETYPNCFTLAVGNCETRKCKVFEISFRKDQRETMFEYLRTLRKTKSRMVGFNNVGFDYPVLHKLLKNKTMTPQEIYDYAMSVIRSESKFEFIVKDKDTLIEQIDIYKIHHFDNKARATSLKMLEFNMRSENIEDLPFPVGKILTGEEIDVLLKYNKHDMFQTYLFYKESKTQIEFREQLSSKYNKNFMNFNDTKIGKDYFIMKLEEHIPECCYKKGKIQQTKRDFIELKDCIFDYVKFERPEFNAILKWFKNQRITETKGVFSDILESDLGEVAQYASMITKKKKLKDNPTEQELNELKQQYPMGWLDVVELKSKKLSYNWCWKIAKTLNVVIDGFQFDFGTGGIHGSIESDIVYSDDTYIVIDWDVSSFYPNLAIKNRIYPEHLSEQFCDIYEDVYNQRKSYGKGTAENAMMKLALNGTYGASNDQFSPFYDPKFTMGITINGQLSLCMIVEKLIAEIPEFQMVQCNTDGVTFKIPKTYETKSDDIKSWWEDITKLELEKNVYKRMIIRDVNNYIAEYTDGHLKNKGAYQWQGLGWHQNHSAPVISMAAERALVYGESVEEVIKNHDNFMDFMLRTKVPRSSKLVLLKDDMSETQLQNICRYYISHNGGQLIKCMPPMEESKLVTIYTDEEGNEYIPKNKTEETKFEKKYKLYGQKYMKQPDRRIGIDTGWNITPCNDIKCFNNDINYDYYIKSALKLIDLCSDLDEKSVDIDS